MELPLKNFGDLCHFVRGPFGGSLKKDLFKESGFAIYEQQHAINNQFSNIRYFIDDKKFSEMKRFELKPNDLIMSCSGTMGKIAIVPNNIKRGIINQALLKLTPSNDLNKYYLLYWMKSEDFQESIAKYSKGAAIKNVASVKVLKQIEMPFPKIEQQKQIVKILDKSFETIEKAKTNIEKNLQNTKELFASKLNEIFSQKGDGWEEKTLGEVCLMIKRGIPPKYTENEGLVVINQKCIRNHKVNLELSRLHDTNLKSVTDEKLIKIGDVLINSTGTGTLGRIAQVRDIKLKNCTVDTHVTIVRPDSNLFHLDFFGYALIKIESEIEKSGEGASGQTELARTKLENNFNINYPKCHNKQKEIVLILDSLTLSSKQLEQKYQQKLNNLEELKKSILQKAFSGELLK